MLDTQFNLMNYKLKELHFDYNENIQGEDPSFKPQFKMNYRIDGDENVIVLLGIVVNDQSMPFSILTTIEGNFHFNTDVKEVENLDKLVNINCNAILFPFVREIIADCTNRSGLPSLFLPSINFIKLYNEQEAEKIEK